MIVLLSLAAFLDRWESRLRRVGERIGWPQQFLQEFIAYRGDPRMSLEEFWVRFVLLRMETEPRIKAIKTEADAREFYQISEYMLWRNLVHRRHSAWRRVLWTMRGDVGCLQEMGCGIAPVSAWCLERKPGWTARLVDLGSPHLSYGRWRVNRLAGQWTWHGRAHVVTAIDVFEHLADPLAMARRCVEDLAPGGFLHWNAVLNEQQNDLDLATPKQHAETVAYLRSALDCIYDREGYRVSVKR